MVTVSRLVRGRNGKVSRVTVRVAAVSRPPAPSYQLHPDDDRYADIQRALTDRGYFKGDANGKWGDDSMDALRRFQEDQKFADADGKINSLSLIGLGLGPKHGSILNVAPQAVAPTAAPSSLDAAVNTVKTTSTAAPPH